MKKFDLMNKIMDLKKLRKLIIRQLEEELVFVLNSIFIIDPYFKLQFLFTYSPQVELIQTK